MINKEKLSELRECQGRGELFNAMAEDMSLAGELLDAAESEIELRAKLDEQKQVTHECVMRADRHKAELQTEIDHLKASIAITVRIFRALQEERDALHAKLKEAFAALEEASSVCHRSGCGSDLRIDAVLARIK